jgi:guanylate kinase
LAGKPVFVITGPSGAGKGTLIERLMGRVPDLELAVSATTRERRPGEEHGREYWFLSEDEFTREVADDAFLEWVSYVSTRRYGTLRSELERIAAGGKAPVLELELDGAVRVRDEVPGSVTIFIDAPLDELERRLRERATESTGEIDDRIALASRQKAQAGEFDHVVVNDDVDRAAEELIAIVARELDAWGESHSCAGPITADGRTGKAGTS